jgi:Protein of unknown function (DUF2802)
MTGIANLQLDWTALGSALSSASLLLLGAGLCLLARLLVRERRVSRADLARIFEQLDLLRFDAQQAGAASAPGALSRNPSLPAEPPVLTRALQAPAGTSSTISDYYTAAQLAARGASTAEIAERCGIVTGEARVLVALQQARARRSEPA